MKLKTMLRRISALVLAVLCMIPYPNSVPQVQAATTDVTINATNFPDPAFRSYVKKLNDGSTTLTAKKIASIKSMDLSNLAIEDLTGISYFTALTTLRLSDPEKDIAVYSSMNKATYTKQIMEKYPVYSEMGVDPDEYDPEDDEEEEYYDDNEDWDEPDEDDNFIEELDLNALTSLKTLYANSIGLSSLKISKCTALTHLEVNYNDLDTLALGNLTALKTLAIGHMYMEKLNLQNQTELTTLYARGLFLTNSTLNLSYNTKLQYLDCSGSNFKLDVSKNVALVLLNCCCKDLYKTGLNLSSNTALKYLYCAECKLLDLNLTKNTALITAICRNNYLTKVDTSKNTNLTTFDLKDVGYHKHVVKYPSEFDCTVGGKYTVTCVLCKRTYTETYKPTDHDWEIEASREATCNRKGVKLLQCTVCDASDLEFIDTLSHTWVSKTQADGSKKEVCKVCGTEKPKEEVKEEVKEEPKKPENHNWIKEPGQAPTCQKAGTTDTIYCADCGMVLQERKTLDKVDHKYSGKVSKEPTCGDEGLMEVSCIYCGEVQKTYKLSATGKHEAITPKRVEATCHSDGYIEDTLCRGCGKVLEKGRIISGENHAIDGEICIRIEQDIWPTCAREGLTGAKYCGFCGEMLEGTVEPKRKDHMQLSKIPAIAATCTSVGYTEGEECLCCGAVTRMPKKTTKLAHTVVTDSAKEPTHTTTGLTEGSHCDVCGTILKQQEVIPKLAKYDLSKAKLALSYIEKTYTGKALKPTVTLTYNGEKVPSTEYTVSYSNNTNVGKATVTIKAKSASVSYTGSKSATFKINPKTVSIVNVTCPAQGNLSVTWKQRSTVTGYQVQVATDAAFTKNKVGKSTTKNTTLTKTFKELVSGKYYYVRVRTYQKIGDVKYYSAWTVYGDKVYVK